MDDGARLDRDVISNEGRVVPLDFGNVHHGPVADVGIVPDGD